MSLTFWPPDPGISNTRELKFAFRGLPLGAAQEFALAEGMTAPEEYVFSAEKGPVFEQLAALFDQFIQQVGGRDDLPPGRQGDMDIQVSPHAIAADNVPVHVKAHGVGRNKRVVEARQRPAFRVIRRTLDAGPRSNRILYQAIAGKQVTPGRPIVCRHGPR